MRIKIRYSGKEISTDLPAGTSLGQVLGNTGNQAVLGFGANVDGHIGGAKQATSLGLVDGMTVDVYDRSCAKATS